MTRSCFDNLGKIDSLTKATYPEKIYDYSYDPFGNMLTARENGIAVFNKTYTWANRISGYSYDARGNLTQDGSFAQVWDKRNRMTESRTAANAHNEFNEKQ